MYTMRDVCKESGMTYEGLKFYCNQGLVPNVKRDGHNRRVFDQHALEWVKSLSCLKNCEMSITEMQQYLAYCLEGPSSIPVRKIMLAKKQEELREKIRRLQEAVDYIDWKQQLYDDFLSGKRNITAICGRRRNDGRRKRRVQKSRRFFGVVILLSN